MPSFKQAVKLREQLEQAQSIEDTITIVNEKHKIHKKNGAIFKIGTKSQQVIYNKFLKDTATKSVTLNILISSHTLSLKWLIALSHCKNQNGEIFASIATTITAIITNQKQSNINEIVLLELLESLSASSSALLFEAACWQVKQLFVKQSQEVALSIDAQLDNALKAYIANADSPPVKDAAITFLKQAFLLGLDAMNGKPIIPSKLDEIFNKQAIVSQAVECFIDKLTSLDGDTLVCLIQALVNVGQTAKMENQLAAMSLSKKEIVNLSLEQIAQALNIILRSACSVELASTLTAFLALEVKKIKPSVEEAKTFLSQLNSAAVYGKNGERSTACLLHMVNAMVDYVGNDYPLVNQLLSIAGEQKVLFSQAKHSGVSPSSSKASSSHIPNASPSSSSEASNNDIPNTSPYSSPSKTKAIFGNYLSTLLNKNKPISANELVKMFKHLSTVPGSDTVNAILAELPKRLKEIIFSFEQVQGMLHWLTHISRIATPKEIENILAALEPEIIQFQSGQSKSTLYNLLKILPGSQTQKEILARLQPVYR